VLITRLYAGRSQERDPSNLAGGCKMVLDAMTKARILVDDKERWIEAHYYQTPANAAGTWIQIVELEPGGEDDATAITGAPAEGSPFEARRRAPARGPRRTKALRARQPRRGAPVR
jgi:hypothetical protein